jgi:Fe-S cluster biogenesis protein NfuA
MINGTNRANGTEIAHKIAMFRPFSTERSQDLWRDYKDVWLGCQGVCSRVHCAHMKPKEQLMKEIDEALDFIRGGLAMHRGGVDLVDVDPATGVAKVRMRGMCVGCPMSELTLKAGIEETVRMAVPEITEVIAVEDEPVGETCAHGHA